MAVEANSKTWTGLTLALLISLFSTILFSCIKCDLIAQELSNELTPPRIISRTTPIYPVELAEQEISGTVILDVTILPDSTIGYIEIVESIPELDSLAIETVYEWEFIPGLRGDEPSIGIVTVEVEFMPEALFEEIAVVDSVDRQEILTEVNEYTESRRRFYQDNLNRLNYPLYNENYHLFSWSGHQPYTTLNSFSVIPGYTAPFHLLQYHFPFYRTTLSNHTFDFTTEPYELPVTVIEAYLGTGYLDMDYAHVNLAKNDALDIDDLQLRIGMIMENGYWLENYEKSSNFMMDVYYPFDRIAFRWNSMLVNQDIPKAKFRNPAEPEALTYFSENIAQHSLMIANPYLNLGFRYESLSYKESGQPLKPERELWQLNLNRSFRLDRHSLAVNWEYFWTDVNDFSLAPYLSDKHSDIRKINYSWETDRFEVNSTLFSGYGYKYHSTSEFSVRVTPELSTGLYYLTNDLREINYLAPYPENVGLYQAVKEDLAASLSYNHNSYSGTIKIGREESEQYKMVHISPVHLEITGRESFYLQTDYSLGISYRQFDIDLYGNGKMYPEEEEDLLYLPQYYFKTGLQLRLNLPHNNALTLGLINNHTSPFKGINNKVLPATNILDAYFRISITNLFDIQADFKNLTEEIDMLGYPVAGMHINASLRWFFFN